MNSYRSLSYLIPLLFLILFSCGKDEANLEEHSRIIRTQTYDNLTAVLKETEKLEVEVLYEAGAEPYTGKSFRQKSYWSFLEANIKGIYDSRDMEVELVIPKELDDMTLVEKQDKSSWTAADILGFAEKYAKKKTVNKKPVIHAIFVKGHYKDQEGIKSNIIGINITGTLIITIFKDVVENMGNTTDDNFAKFSEQSTLVHEVGHAFGLVNNGIKQSSEHHDHEHGAHCSNEKCVMYWKNEGREEMLDFIKAYLTSGSEIMFGTKCMNDFKNY